MTIQRQTTTDERPHVADPEWVADLVDTFRAGDLDVAVADLTALLQTMRRAAKARRILSTVSPSLLQQGLEVRAGRRSAEQ